jgi:AraC-like DNA-binding protein
MDFFGNIFDIIILLGAIQGFIISAILLRSKRGLLSDKLLAFILILIALACLNIFFLETNVLPSTYGWIVFSEIIPLTIVMPLGPLVYYYTWSLQQPTFQLTPIHYPHFYSVGIDLLPSLFAILYRACLALHFFHPSSIDTWYKFIHSYNMYADVPRWISISVYTIFAWRLVPSQKETNTSSDGWPKHFVTGFTIFQFVWLLHLIPYLIPVVSDFMLQKVSWYPIYIPLAVMVYWLGFNGLLKHLPPNKGVIKTVDNELAVMTMTKLKKAMEVDRLFLDPALSLSALGKHTNLSVKIISAVLNQYANKGFNEFVNEYRIDEVKKLLANNKNTVYTISALALECGFNSQATFQRTFKQVVGVSPKEFQLKNAPKIEKNSAQIRN